MCIAKKNTTKLERKCECDDMMWIDWKGIKVAGGFRSIDLTICKAKRKENERITAESIRSKRKSDDINRC